MNVSFSIIIPVYNTERYLMECINSLIDQLTDNDEVILINDGSTDNSSQICTEIANTQRTAIHLIQQRNKGLSAARNAGMHIAKNDYVLFIDSDDKVSREYLPVLRKKLSDNKEIDVLMFGYETFPNGSKYQPGFSEGLKRTRYELLEGNHRINRNNDFCFSWRFAVKHKYAEMNNLYFDEEVRIGEDYLFNARILLSGGIVYVLNKPLYMYRIDNPDSIMRRRYKPNLEEQLSCQYAKKLEIIEKFNLHSVTGWDNDFAWYYVTAFRDMLIRNIYFSNEKNKIRSLKRVLSLPLIENNYKVIGNEYWKYSKRGALFHLCCKYRFFLPYVDYKVRRTLHSI